MELDASGARSQLYELERTLKELAQKDPEQEVRGIAVPILDAVLEATKPLIANHPVARAAYDVLSPETIAEGEPIRAIDALFVVRAYQAALGPEPLDPDAFVVKSPFGRLPDF